MNGMNVRTEPKRRLSTEELMLSNCSVGEDSWESLGLQGDPTSQRQRKSILNIHWKDWCWSWSSSSLATWCKDPSHWKRPWCWERLRAGVKGDVTEDEMVGWYHWLSGYEFEQTPDCCCFSVTQSCPTLWDPMEWGMPGFPILCHLPELAQTHVHWLGDAIHVKSSGP